MAFLPVGSFARFRNKSDSWFHRVPDNLRQAPQASTTAANAAALHFETIDLSARRGRAQSASIGLHVAILAALILALTSFPTHGPVSNFIVLGPGKPLLSYRRRHDIAETGHARIAFATSTAVSQRGPLGSGAGRYLLCRWFPHG